MRLPQRFHRIPSEETRDGQSLVLSELPQQTRMEASPDVESAMDSGTQLGTATPRAAGGSTPTKYTVSHPKNTTERIEQLEKRMFGTQFYGRFHDTFIAGWRAGLLRAFLLCLFALIINIAVYAWLGSTYNTVKGTATIISGSCSLVQNANIGIHAALNILSTLVLGASTYAMQGLTSPSRNELDATHAKGKWLEIGTSSVRNLLHVRKRNMWIWGILAITSLPFHLFFNTVFFYTKQANQYAVALVAENYLDNTSFQPTEENVSPALFRPANSANPECHGYSCPFDVRNATRIIELLKDARDITMGANFTHMEPQQCMQNYSTGFQLEYSDVLVVSTSVISQPPLLWTRYPQRLISVDTGETNQDPFSWICSDLMDSKDAEPDRCGLEMATERFDSGGNWTIQGYPVSHCLARKIDSTCQLQFNGYLMIAVVVFGVIKVFTICYLVFERPTGQYLRTIGDAIASFLEHEDPTTKDMCLVSSQQIRKNRHQTRYEPQMYDGTRPRWFTAANTTEFFASIGVSAFYIVVLSIALFFAIDGANGFAFTNGLGQPDIQSLASFKRDDIGSSGIVPTLLIANIPQLGFSILYIVYTNIWNKLLVAQEFNTLIKVKKGLRVSERPKGKQRTSRFFTLPMRYALPLMACSAALHWLCSQSFFMVRFDGVDAHGRIDERDQLVRLGYSATGVIALITVSSAMLVVTVCVASLRRLNSPLGETSMSVVLSAACHGNRHEPQPWMREVQWGVVTSEGERDESGSQVEHCAFTTEFAGRLVTGRIYA